MAISVDGIKLPDPTNFNIRRFDLDAEGTGRNELGYELRDRIRQGIYEIKLEFVGTSSEIHLIESAIEPAKINVIFPTPIGHITKIMQAKDRDGPKMINFNNVTDKIYWNLSFNLIEY